ncbi:fibrinogen-like protein A [Uranotaenia lowii]|uniref:fibrinogen-like protein A n=1 Tax=Uranotaenia lowii TaxID=190385 RepID=UPI0024791FEB|nr:fibrinogen-like protein A [Uranotaenia lowii]
MKKDLDSLRAEISNNENKQQERLEMQNLETKTTNEALRAELADMREMIRNIQQSQLRNDPPAIRRTSSTTPGPFKSINGFQPINQEPLTCADVNGNKSGVYTLYPGGGSAFEAFCDRDYEQGGWTVIQNRFDGSVDFARNWTDYERGFGDLQTEFWLGLDKIHRLTSHQEHELHVMVEALDGTKGVAKYDLFKINGADDRYRLTELGRYSGNAGDSLFSDRNQMFSTVDNNNSVRCPVNENSGWWWYHNCLSEGNLNGIYKRSKSAWAAMTWLSLKNSRGNMQRSRMMIRATGKAREIKGRIST